MEDRVDLSDEAVENIREICEYIGVGKFPAAAKWYRGLRQMIFSLDRDPLRGKRTSESPELHRLLYGKNPHVYRIIYAVDPEGRVVRVVHIRHGARSAFVPGPSLG